MSSPANRSPTGERKTGSSCSIPLVGMNRTTKVCLARNCSTRSRATGFGPTGAQIDFAPGRFSVSRHLLPSLQDLSLRSLPAQRPCGTASIELRSFRPSFNLKVEPNYPLCSPGPKDSVGANKWLEDLPKVIFEWTEYGASLRAEQCSALRKLFLATAIAPGQRCC